MSSSIQEDREKSFGIIKELEKRTFYLVAENERLGNNLKAMEDDYRSIMGIMEKARKMVVLQDGNRESRVKL